ncbi:hypothetical protein CZ771_00130 [Actinomycetales bacterium JB111]|nr:hypothetical protein CZ771_00130 [Actinomycetales bacterium JB111]
MRVWDRAVTWMLDGRHFTYAFSAMRIGFGAMTLIILALYLPNYSYSFGEGSRWGEAYLHLSATNDYAFGISSIFSRTDPDWLTSIKLACFAAVTVAYTIGWRMRIISPLFVVLWLGYTSVNSMVLNTGHYQTFRVLIIFLLFADLSRHWSLDARRRSRSGEDRALSVGRASLPSWVPVLANNFAVVLVMAQLCIIYVSSALWKLQGTMWESGEAIYYPLRLEQFALVPGLNDLVWQVTPAVYLGSWLSVYMQLLFPLALLFRWPRRVGWVIITGMHASIAIFLSLPWFSLVMILGDFIFIRDSTWRRVLDWLKVRLTALGQRIGHRFGRGGPTARRARRDGRPHSPAPNAGPGQETDPSLAEDTPDESGHAPDLSRQATIDA